MAAGSLSTMNVLDCFQVSPPSGSSPHHAIIPLSFFDALWIHSTDPVERLYFYPFPNYSASRLATFVSSLRSSLSLTLKSFYPLAGKLQRNTESTDDKFEIVYREGDSVSFTVSECNDGSFKELASSSPRGASNLQPLVPCLAKSDQSQPLFAVQVTLFRDEGIVIGTSVHHVVCDGNSSMQFMHSWAATCLSDSLDSSFINPIIDKTLISDPSNLYTEITRFFSTPRGPAPSTESTSNDIVLASFTLNKENIQILKQVISSKAEKMNKSFRCSTIVAVYAFAWVCHVKSRDGESDRKRGIIFSADFRARIQPPLPTTYFGNCVGPCMVRVDRDDIFSTNGLVVAAEGIAKAIEELSYGAKLADDVMSMFEFFRSVDLVTTISGSPRFRVYEVDFGLGKPTKVEMVSIVKTGAIAIADNRDDEAGIEIGIPLKKNEMNRFEMYFTRGLEFE